MDNTKLELTNAQEIEDFKLFCQYKQDLLAEHQQWKEFKAFCKQMNFGSMSLSVEDGRPKKILNPMQTIIFGILRK